MSLLFRRTHAYQATFKGPAGEAVLADLAKFCHADRPVHVPGDPVQTAYNDGMRRVYLRIASFLNMTDQEVRRLAETETRHGPDSDR